MRLTGLARANRDKILTSDNRVGRRHRLRRGCVERRVLLRL